jgi:hypothetical protein
LEGFSSDPVLRISCYEEEIFIFFLRKTVTILLSSHKIHHLKLPVLQEETVDFVHHPVNAYRLLRHVAVGWALVEAALQAELHRRGGSAGRRLTRVLRRREERHVPDEPDVDGVATGIVR